MDDMISRLLFVTISLCLFAGRSTAEKAQALFVLGDSFADTGNRNPCNQSTNRPWRIPYGLTWPGFPAGRFSSGKIQTDFWADILGLPVPIAYELLRSQHCVTTAEKIRQGVNFAVGGSGIFRDYGYTTVPEQVKQLRELIGGSPEFDSHKLSRSIVLISVVGNDYGAYVTSRNGSIEGLIDLVKPVTRGIIKAVKDLYEFGLRNFVVSNNFSFGCDPEIGKQSCNSKSDDVLALHTRLLRMGLQSLISCYKDSSIIISDLVSAANFIFSNPAQFGFVDLFVPCCAEKGRIDNCGSVDKTGRALYEVCFDVNERFYWDSIHPTQRGWYAIMSLYSNGAKLENKTTSFVDGAPNVIEWLHSLGFVAYRIYS